MKTAATLADHLRLAASQAPKATALIAGDQHWSFAEWLASCAALAAGQANTGQAWCATGNSRQLASLACAASLQNRPFWPVDRSPRDIPSPTALPAATALIISTSGSEGKPRAVLLSAANLDAATAASNQRLPLGPGDLWLNCLPLYHIGGQSILWRCARAAAGVLLHEGFAAERVAADLARYPVSHLSLVPSMLALLLDSDARPPATLRHVLIGGAALSQTLYARATAAGWPLTPSYGMSETAAQIASWQPADGPWQQGQVGRALPGSEIGITSDGRIRLRGPQLMLGYLNGGGPDADGWLTTGDLGHLDGEGRLTVIGRADDMLISGGRNVHPLDVEACLAAFPGVSDVAVTGLPDPLWGDRVVALVVGTVSAEALQAHARLHLPSAALPRKMVFLDRLPRNPAGKLERTTLRRIAAEAAA